MDIPGLSTIYAIVKRDIDRTNDIFQQRRDLAHEMVQRCQEWAKALLDTFDEAVKKWETEGQEAAKERIVEQQEDFMKLDYWSLQYDSPILAFLREDERFSRFADSCLAFYGSAIDVKRIAYGGIEDHEGNFIAAGNKPIKAMVKLWRNDVERMLENVTVEYHRIVTLKPK